MTKIEEILQENVHVPKHGSDPEWTEDNVRIAMKEYAEYYAKKCLEITALNVDCGNIEDWQYDIVRESILNIKLPEHE